MTISHRDGLKHLLCPAALSSGAVRSRTLWQRKAADILLTTDGLDRVTDWNAALNVLQYEGYRPRGRHCGRDPAPSRTKVSSFGNVGVTVTGGGAFPTDGVTRPVPPMSETY